MNISRRPRMVLICPQCDGNDVGESWCGFQWASQLARRCDLTVLSLRFPGRVPPSEQLHDAKVVEWDTRLFLETFPRLNRSFKPWYFFFYRAARAWLRQAIREDQDYDLFHQLTPIAMRFPTPCAGLGIRYIIGPVGGGLKTPEGFKAESGTEPSFLQIRNLDQVRLRYDPWMRRTYEDAKLVICSAPYVQDRLSVLNVKRTAIESEVGVDRPIGEDDPSTDQSGKLRLLFVGRVIRTKGVRDAIRAMALLKDVEGISLKIAGTGEDLDACKREARELGVDQRVAFLGHVPHGAIEALYRQSDLFVFPSYREPTGIVLYEAMRFGLPVVTTDIGGPGYIVDDASGIRLPAISPDQLAQDIANAIRSLSDDPLRLKVLSSGAKRRIEAIGNWEAKIDRMMNLYDSVIAASDNSAF